MVTGSRGDLRVSGPLMPLVRLMLNQCMRAHAATQATPFQLRRGTRVLLLNQNVALFICINITVNLLLQHLETAPACTWLSVYLNLIYHLPHCSFFYPHFLPPLPFLPLFSLLLSPPLWFSSPLLFFFCYLPSLPSGNCQQSSMVAIYSHPLVVILNDRLQQTHTHTNTCTHAHMHALTRAQTHTHAHCLLGWSSLTMEPD